MSLWATLDSIATLNTPEMRVEQISPPGLSQFVYEMGHQSDSYLSTAPGRETFWCSSYEGLISYRRIGKHVLVSGGLIAPAGLRPQLLREFLAFVKSRRWRAAFFCIPEEDLAIFRAAGYVANKVGEEAVLPLADLTFAGSRYEWVRRQSNFCQRHGVRFEELKEQDFSFAEWSKILAELSEVTRDGLRDKPQRSELTFFDGSIGAHELGARRLFVARTGKSSDQRIEGFLVCNPMNGGRSWSTEIYRHRFNSPRGTIPYLFHQTALLMKQQGVEQLNLCIAPGRHCEQPVPGDKPFIRHALVYFWKHGSWLFDLKGIDHFKSRFRPQYENRYICSPPDLSVSAILATIQALGVLRVDPFKLLRQLWTRSPKTTVTQPE